MDKSKRPNCEISNNISRTFLSHLTPSEHTKIDKLIVRQRIVRCILNDIESKVLRDTGAQVSISSREMMEKFFNKVAKKDITKLIDGELNLTAVNVTKIAYSG